LDNQKEERYRQLQRGEDMGKSKTGEEEVGKFKRRK
jgi:hypothetical protein